MPYKMTKTDGKYKVTSPSGTRAKGTTKKKAQKQMNLLRGIKHGWKPTHNPVVSPTLVGMGKAILDKFYKKVT